MKQGALAVPLAERRRVADCEVLESKYEVYVLSKIIFCAVETVLNSVGRFYEATSIRCKAA